MSTGGNLCNYNTVVECMHSGEMYHCCITIKIDSKTIINHSANKLEAS